MPNFDASSRATRRDDSTATPGRSRRRCPGRFSNDELRLEQLPHWRALAAKAGQYDVYRARANIIHRLTNRGQWDASASCELDVVDSYDRDVVGDADAGVEQSIEQAERAEVVAAEHRVWA
jgi:hypothetical protein